MKETKKIPCPACGAGKRFEIDRLVCDYCGHEEAISLQPSPLVYEPFSDFKPTNPDRWFRCESCGASFETKAFFRSGYCPYCQTPLIAPKQNEKEAAFVLPFALSQKEAYKRVKTKIGSLWFAPDDFKRFFKKYKELKAYYFPSWVFTFRVTVRYTGQRGIDRIESYRIYTKQGPKTAQRIVTDWYPVSGMVDLGFRDIYAFSYKDTPMMARRLRYELKQSVVFEERMLAGQETYEFDTSSKESFVAAQAAVEGAIRQAIRSDIGGDRQIISTIDRNFYDVGQTLLYVPVFWGSVEYKGKFYDFFVNAQTGEVIGERPYSWVKIVFAIIGAAALIAAILFLLHYFGYIDLSLPDELEY